MPRPSARRPSRLRRARSVRRRTSLLLSRRVTRSRRALPSRRPPRSLRPREEQRSLRWRSPHPPGPRPQRGPRRSLPPRSQPSRGLLLAQRLPRRPRLQPQRLQPQRLQQRLPRQRHCGTRNNHRDNNADGDDSACGSNVGWDDTSGCDTTACRGDVYLCQHDSVGCDDTSCCFLEQCGIRRGRFATARRLIWLTRQPGPR